MKFNEGKMKLNAQLSNFTNVERHCQKCFDSFGIKVDEDFVHGYNSWPILKNCLIWFLVLDHKLEHLQVNFDKFFDKIESKICAWLLRTNHLWQDHSCKKTCFFRNIHIVQRSSTLAIEGLLTRYNPKSITSSTREIYGIRYIFWP